MRFDPGIGIVPVLDGVVLPSKGAGLWGGAGPRSPVAKIEYTAKLWKSLLREINLYPSIVILC